MMRTVSFKKILLLLLLAAWQSLNFSAMPRHNFHTSLTRMDYNMNEKTVEITIQLFTHDLQPLLEKRGGKQIDLEKSPEVNQLIEDYLAQNFIFRNQKGEPQKLVWVGKELEVDTAYIYLQIPLAENLDNTSLQNTLFFESFPEQTNLVLARSEKRKADLLFVSGDKFKEITFGEQSSSNGE